MRRKLKRNPGCGVTLQEAFERLIQQKKENGKLRTAENYRSTVNKLWGYLSGPPANLTLRHITGDWVSGFVRWLEEKHPGKPQTADFYFRNLRALYNAACAMYKVEFPEGAPPFGKTVFREKPSAKRALAKQEMGRLFSPAFRENAPLCLCESLDILLFILFMRGMVFQDVYNLSWNMVDTDNHVHYLRSKTKVPIDTEISSEARIIMERYRTQDCPYVFPFLHRCKSNKKKEINEQSALRRVNRHAHRLGKLCGLPIPLSTYVMRHTFATLMLEASKPVELISQCLGHTSIRTTELYLSRISVARVDKEVNDMFDKMLREQVNKMKKNRKRPKVIEKSLENPPILGNNPASAMPHTGRNSEMHPPEEKYPFLCKKETQLTQNFYLGTYNATKIGILRKITKYYQIISSVFFLQS